MEKQEHLITIRIPFQAIDAIDARMYALRILKNCGDVLPKEATWKVQKISKNEPPQTIEQF